MYALHLIDALDQFRAALMRPRRHFGPRKRTAANRRDAAAALLLNARSLEAITVETLVQGYGLKAGEAAAMLEAARQGRML